MRDYDGETITEMTEAQPRRPTVVKWHIAYCVFEVVLDLALAVGGVAVLFYYAPDVQNDEQQIIVYALGVGMIVGGLFGAMIYGFGALVPRRPWGWIVGLVLIIFGLTSCTVVICLPLLIYWFKPETKQWYRMKP